MDMKIYHDSFRMTNNHEFIVSSSGKKMSILFIQTYPLSLFFLNKNKARMRASNPEFVPEFYYYSD